MACFHPVRAYMTADGEVRFSEVRGDFVRTLELPCGNCIGCRLERSRQWALRCVHESKLHAENCFITLTYSDDWLPADGSLDYRHFQLFMYRLRKRLDRPVRFYMCGEYGDVGKRPHYHAILFGFDFPDKKLLSIRGGNRLYKSALLDALWRLGYCSVGGVSFQSASYIARYCVKKVTGDAADAHYKGRMPEFNRMSLKPGIGHGWFEKFYKDWYPKGEIVADGKPGGSTKYYDRLYGRVDAYGFERLQFSRSERGRSRAWDNTDARLSVREVVTKGRYRFYEEK